jgi:DNA-binding CsgD family transcriptional regulator
MAADPITVLESSYRFDLPTQEWLRGLATAAGALVEGHDGVFAALYRVGDGVDILAAASVGCSLDLAQSLFRVELPESERRALTQAYRTQRFGTFLEVCLPFPVGLAHYRQLFAAAGIGDIQALNACDPTGFGCSLNFRLSHRCKISPRTRALWSRIGAHVASGYRMRRHLDSADPIEGADAVLEPGGELAHAAGEATSRSARDRLRDAVRHIEHARGQMRRSDPQEAVQLWRGLVDGRWSLLDCFDTDGRRYVVARRNDPSTDDPRALTPRERQIAGYVEMGHSNKLIAYELGLTPSAVSRHIASSAAKLGARTRTELVAALARSRGPKGQG